MDLQFYPNDQAPKPRDEVRIEEIELAVYRDRRRIFVHVRITPFQERPNLILIMRGEDDRVVSELNIIETMHNDMELTMHLRGVDEPTGFYTLEVDVFYETRLPPQDTRVEAFEIPAEANGDAQGA